MAAPLSRTHTHAHTHKHTHTHTSLGGLIPGFTGLVLRKYCNLGLEPEPLTTR